MAVPKKKTSKSRSRMRKATWKKTASLFESKSFYLLVKEFQILEFKSRPISKFSK
jgi:hypothetical protein